MKGMLTKKEAATELECTTRTIDRYVDLGRLEKVTLVPRRVRITQASVRKFLKGSALAVLCAIAHAENAPKRVNLGQKASVPQVSAKVALVRLPAMPIGYGRAPRIAVLVNLGKK